MNCEHEDSSLLLTGPPGQNQGGLTFTRWGRTTCPFTSGTTLIYDGIMAGSKYDEGGGANYLCLPKDPEYLQYTIRTTIIHYCIYRALVNVIISVWQKYIAICNCYGFRKTAYFCGFDNDLESVPGSESSIDPATIYFTESTCNGLPCPPYVAGREITCGVH